MRARAVRAGIWVGAMLALVGCGDRVTAGPDASRLDDDAGREASDSGPAGDAGREIDGGSGGIGEGTCSSPHRLVFESHGTKRVSGALAAGESARESTCGPAEGVERVYELHTALRGRLRVELRETTSFDGSIYLRRACDGDDLACDWRPASPGADFEVPVLDAGTWLLIVDGRGSGEYELDVALDPLLEGESCDAVEVLGALDSGSFDVRGELGEHAWDPGGSCAAFYRVYEATLPARGSLGLSITPGDFALRVDGGPGCDAAVELECGEGALALDELEAGTYWIWVGGTEFGGYILNVSFTRL